jgi:tetratricopeptide (TPR) repeat protein
MKKILFMVVLSLSLTVCLTSPTWAGGLGDFNAGEDAFYAGNYDEAIRLYTRAIASGELSQEQLSEVYELRGFTWDDKGDYDKAIADYTKAIEIDPKNSYAYINRGVDWYDKGDYDRAIADYTRAIEIDPKNSDAYYNRSLAWDKKGDDDKAKDDYAKAIELWN